VSLTITDQVMRSTDTPHTAVPWSDPTEDHVAGLGPEDIGWRVTWLPDRLLTYNEAISAMSIAEWVGQLPADVSPEGSGETFWVNIDGWAGELGLTGPEAVARASEPPS
jgi:hypothetical protein